MTVSVEKYRNASTDELEKLNTGALMKLRKLTYSHAHCDCCSAVVDEDQREFNIWVSTLQKKVMEILKSRPHYPNKAERKAKRRASAKQRA